MMDNINDAVWHKKGLIKTNYEIKWLIQQ